MAETLLLITAIAVIVAIGVVGSDVSVWEANIWGDAVIRVPLPLADTFTDPQVGDFVEFDAEGKLVRSPSGWGGSATAENYRGLIIATAPDSREHPAFSEPYNRPMVALLSPNKTELLMREIDFFGNYVSPTLRPNDPIIFVFDEFTKRWGVQYASNPNIPTGRVMKVLSDGRLLVLFGGDF
jgi:hypothetical protein